MVLKTQAISPESLRLIPVTNWHDWDSYLELSNQGSIFLQSSYLQTSGLTDAARFLSMAGEIVGGAVIPELISNLEVIPIRHFATYQSIWFTASLPENFREVQKRTKVLLQLGNLLKNIDSESLLSLHWSITDVRGLEWAFFGYTDKSIRFVPRYSGVLEFSHYSSFEQYLKTIASGRKSDFKSSSSVSIDKVKTTKDISEFLDLYELTVPFVDSASKNASIKEVEQIISKSILKGTGTLWFARDHSGVLLSGVFIQEFAGYLYYQFGASASHNLRISPNAIILLKIIEEGFTKKLKGIDFVGMNSPKRGAFKESFNPRPTLYFQVEIN